jgi:hypothetical protein
MRTQNIVDTGRFSHELIRGPVGNLELLVFPGDKPESKPILVVPNGYGILGYTKTVCRELQPHASTVVAINVRGQGQSDGELEPIGAGQDVAAALCWLGRRSGDRKAVVYAHCTAMFYLLGLPAQHPVWQDVSQIILYAYLARPAEHYARFCRKARHYHVRLATDIGDLSRYVPEAYAGIPVPFSLVHPLRPANLRRASLDDVDQLRRAAHPRTVETPKEGYSISEREQERLVPSVMRHVIAQLDAVP